MMKRLLILLLFLPGFAACSATASPDVEALTEKVTYRSIDEIVDQ